MRGKLRRLESHNFAYVGISSMNAEWVVGGSGDRNVTEFYAKSALLGRITSGYFEQNSASASAPSTPFLDMRSSRLMLTAPVMWYRSFERPLVAFY